MTIGWGTVGTIWDRPIFIALVRPSRYTHALMEETGEFTVNLLPIEDSETVAYVGEVSGREHDKFAERGLDLEPSTAVKVPSLARAELVYECRTVQKTEVDPATFAPAIASRFYPQGNYHTVYFGEIVACRAEEGVNETR
jgi:flavin reductase (DIM6/NTAB) family NADH-FMN oxidoreductase RutF